MSTNSDHATAARAACRALAAAGVFAALLAPAVAGATTYGRFYQYEVVAKSGDLNLVNANGGPSINARGDVAFVGNVAAGESLYFRSGAGALTSVNPTFIGGTRTFPGGVQLTESGLIAARDRVSGAPPSFFGRTWDAASGFQTVFVRGGTAQPFDSLVSGPSINASGIIAIAGVQGGLTYVVKADSSGAIAQFLAGEPIRPMIADDGRVVLRKAGQIILLNAAFTQVEVIASTADFTEVGLSPGISDDGKVVVFYGSLAAGRGAAYQAPDGPGIFASIETAPGVRRLLRVDRKQIERLNTPWKSPVNPNGVDQDGICDPGEVCVQDILSVDPATGAAINFLATGYDKDVRVAVSSQIGSVGSLDGASIVVAYVATPDGGNFGLNPFRNAKGLWTTRIDLRVAGSVLKPRAFMPVSVVQEGDKIENEVVQIAGLVLYDPIARVTHLAGSARQDAPGDHQLAFQVSTAGGFRIVRAIQTDTDSDGLLDHWETQGIDYDGDMVIDLPLAAAPYNASPTRKDLFVEIDALAGVTLPANTFDTVVAAFANAPVTNPAGANGITLHINPEGQESTSGNPATVEFIGIPAAGNLQGTKLGPAAGICSAPATAFFGTSAMRAGANCVASIGARMLAFRYVLVANEYTLGGIVQASSGISEGAFGVAGSTLMVTVETINAVKEAVGDQSMCTAAERMSWNNGTGAGALACGKRTLRADTFMHEFGHALGLQHGGGDGYNCKPNYLSVMSYTRQFRSYLSTRPLDYSRSALASLDETALTDAGGIAGYAGTVDIVHAAPDRRAIARLGVTANSPVDWTADGAAVSAVMHGVHWVSSAKCDVGSDLLQRVVLVGHDDWSNLKYDLRTQPGLQYFGFSRLLSAGDSLPVEEAPAEASIIAAAAETDFDGDGIANGADNCPAIANPGQADANGNGIGDACEVSGTPVIPDVVGLSVADARTAIQAVGMTVGDVLSQTAAMTPYNQVIVQQPAAGQPVVAGGEVTLTASMGSYALTIVSRKVHAAAGSLEIPIVAAPAMGNASVEPRQEGSGHLLVLQFNQPVTSVGPVSARDGANIDVGSASATFSGNEILFSLRGTPANVRARLSVAGINGLFDLMVPVAFLLGDVGRSGVVSAADLAALKSRAPAAATAQSAHFDVNADGSVNASDLAAARARSGLIPR